MTLNAAALPPAPAPLSAASVDDLDQSAGGATENQAITTPTSANTTRRNRRTATLEEDPIPHVFKPTLVPKPGSASRTDSRNRSEELDLPPTPVQLGISTIPDKPRGLASSSSPRGSKSGSGRRRRRRIDGPITSSPLKPKASGGNASESGLRSAEDLLVIEALESQLDSSEDVELSAPTETGQDDEGNDLPAESAEKESTLHTLRERLEKVKMEVKTLEAAVGNDAQIDDEVLSLLIPTADGGETGTPLSSTNTDEKKAMQYLSLFSPGNLSLTASTETKKIDHRTKVVHTLGLTAPPPWPVHAFAFAFEVVVDAEDARVEKVSRVYTPAHRSRKGLTLGIHKWLRQRLDHPLHQLDVGGVVWGLGQWFAASTERAKILRQLYLQYNSTSTDELKIARQQRLTERDTMALSPYLHRSQLEINVPDQTQTNGPRKKILLLWAINIDWTGEVKSAISIAPSGVSAKTGQDLAAVFGSLFPTRGVPASFEHVLGLLQGDDETKGAGGEPARKRKRKRIT